MELTPMKKIKEALKLCWQDAQNFNPEDRVILFDLLKKHATPLEDKLLYFYLIDGYTLKEIGEIFNVSESRISQRFTNLVNKINHKRRKKKRDSL
jgi:DNA-directed RNA polymerase specialized sigma subunit